ncbi:MAG: PIG-L family deacetylase [Syntrophomonas sp.]
MPRKKFHCLPRAPIAAGKQRVLVLIPHPDDESLGIGAFIHMCCQAGASVRLVLVSDGNRQGLCDLRYEEFRAAANDLGVAASDLRFWGLPDGSLRLYQAAIEDQLEQEIGHYLPDLIIYPHPDDRHQDHCILGRSVERTLTRAHQFGIQAYAYLIHYNFYQLAALFSKHLFPPHSMPDNNDDWQMIILSPEAHQAKHSALLKYRSQRRNPFLYPLFRVSLRNNELLSLRRIRPYS